MMISLVTTSWRFMPVDVERPPSGWDRRLSSRYIIIIIIIIKIWSPLPSSSSSQSLPSSRCQYPSPLKSRFYLWLTDTLQSGHANIFLEKLEDSLKAVWTAVNGTLQIELPHWPHCWTRSRPHRWTWLSKLSKCPNKLAWYNQMMHFEFLMYIKPIHFKLMLQQQIIPT